MYHFGQHRREIAANFFPPLTSSRSLLPKHHATISAVSNHHALAHAMLCHIVASAMHSTLQPCQQAPSQMPLQPRQAGSRPQIRLLQRAQLSASALGARQHQQGGSMGSAAASSGWGGGGGACAPSTVSSACPHPLSHPFRYGFFTNWTESFRDENMMQKSFRGYGGRGG